MNDIIGQKINNFFAGHKQINFKKGELFIRSEDPVYWTYLIEDGVVGEYSESEDGTELTISLHKKGSVFPKDIVLENSQSVNSFKTASCGTVYRVSKDEFKKFISENTDVLLEISKEIIEEKNEQTKRMGCMLFCHAYTRILYAISILANIFGRKDGDTVVIGSKITQQEIASLAGVSRETANVEINKMIEKKIIGVKGKTIVVKNLNLLKEEIEKRRHKK